MEIRKRVTIVISKEDVWCFRFRTLGDLFSFISLFKTIYTEQENIKTSICTNLNLNHYRKNYLKSAAIKFIEPKEITYFINELNFPMFFYIKGKLNHVELNNIVNYLIEYEKYCIIIPIGREGYKTISKVQ